jgi:type IV secretory pathway TrbD component
VEGRDHWGYQVVDRRIILKWVLDKYGVTMWTVIIWFRKPDAPLNPQIHTSESITN